MLDDVFVKPVAYNDRMPALIVFRSAHFTIEQSEETPIPGYLILRASAPAPRFAELSEGAQRELGLLLARADAAIDRLLAPERVYALRFGEQVEQIHFHLFPRTASMRELYHGDGEQPMSDPIDAAQMFRWARQPDVVKRLRFTMTCQEAARQIERFLNEGRMDGKNHE
jgi:diadenosine tetraphosphate (Ap4A) HIT family hydrolase